MQSRSPSGHRAISPFLRGFRLRLEKLKNAARARPAAAAYWQFWGCQTQPQFFTRLSTRGQQRVGSGPILLRLKRLWEHRDLCSDSWCSQCTLTNLNETFKIVPRIFGRFASVCTESQKLAVVSSEQERVCMYVCSFAFAFCTCHCLYGWLAIERAREQNLAGATEIQAPSSLCLLMTAMPRGNNLFCIMYGQNFALFAQYYSNRTES